MIVTEANFHSTIERLAQEKLLAYDLETEGFGAYTGDQIVGLAIASSKETAYFDLNTRANSTYHVNEWLADLNVHLFQNPEIEWCAHNAKFDLGFLVAAGIQIRGKLWCTAVHGRVEYNAHMLYSLDASGKRIGVEKSDVVKAYMDKHGLFTKELIPGKKKVFKNYQFYNVPADVLGPYGEQDARVCYDLAIKQKKTFAEWEKTRVHSKSILPVVQLERDMIRVIQGMEQYGIRVDRDYCEKAAAFESAGVAHAQAEFLRATGQSLTDSAKFLAGVFAGLGLVAGRTAKGNPSFTDDVLGRLSHPAADALRAYRDHSKRLGTYFSSFLHYSRRTGRIHCSFNSGGTEPGRLSCSEPNLQNLPANAEAEDCAFPARRSFIADPGHVLVSLDWKAMEYYLLLDQCGQMDLIEEVKAGKDLHLATAELMGLSGPKARNTAKTINFMLLYGGGIAKLASLLMDCHHDEDTLRAICRKYVWESSPKPEDQALLEGVDLMWLPADVEKLERAEALKKAYFQALPQVEKWVTGVMETAKRRGYVFNWTGRRCHFPVQQFVYAAPNHVIQGGCGDIMKRFLVDVTARLAGTRSRLQLTIHDEGVFSVRETELDLISDIRDSMLKAYPHKHLAMDCSVYFGQNLYDMEPWHGAEAGNEVRGASAQGSAQAAV